MFIDFREEGWGKAAGERERDRDTERQRDRERNTDVREKHR